MAFTLKQLRQHRLNRKALCIDLLGGQCINCGSTKNLEFDHINPESVEFRICMGLTFKIDRLLIELQKCQLLCKSCHLAKTKIDQDHSLPEHGKISTYNNHHCRCSYCTKANNNYYRQPRIKEARNRYLRKKRALMKLA